MEQINHYGEYKKYFSMFQKLEKNIWIYSTIEFDIFLIAKSFKITGCKVILKNIFR